MNRITKISRIFLILLLFPVVVSAQDWQNICSPGITFYKDSIYTCKAFRLDSLEVLGINDTLFYSFLALRDTNTSLLSIECADTSYGSILGTRILKQTDNRIVFFNLYNDSIILKPLSTVNEFWTCFQLINGVFIQAKVTSLEIDTIMGLQDSLKIITFQAKDSLNQNISHHLNGQSIWLYMHHGIGKVFDFYDFPNDSLSYFLSGQTHNQLGDQDFGWRDIFDFDIGDEFHYKGKHISPYYYGFESIDKVLDKTIFRNHDSVTYTFEHCEYRFNPSGPGWEYLYDTINRTYNFLEWDTISWIFAMPDEFRRKDTLIWSYASEYYSYTDTSKMKRIKGRLFDKYALSGDTCWFTSNFFIFDSTEYANGLGQTLYSRDIDFSKLVYYKKGSETWGIPISTDCSTLLPVEDVTVPQSKISIYPNPVSTHITIETPFQGQLTILNLQGQELLNQQITEPKTQVDISTLPSGIYFVRVTGEGIVKVGKIIKK